MTLAILKNSSFTAFPPRAGCSVHVVPFPPTATLRAGPPRDEEVEAEKG